MAKHQSTLPFDATIPMSLEYLAGIIDGEGSIQVMTSNYGYRYVYLCVVNTCRELLERIQQNYGGRINQHCYKQKRAMGWKDCFRWNVSGHRARVVLEAVVPFLIVKRDKAMMALATRQGYISNIREEIQ